MNVNLFNSYSLSVYYRNLILDISRNTYFMNIYLIYCLIIV